MRLLREGVKWTARHGALALGHLISSAAMGPRILCYHGVCPQPDDEWSVTPAQLRAHMHRLRMHHHPVSLSAIVDWLMGAQDALPQRAVAVTFDDGFSDVLAHAAPILAEAGVPGTAFVPTAMVSGEKADPSFSSRQAVMSWTEVRQLHQAGWTIGSHARTHPPLRSLNTGQVEAELRISREELQQALGVRIELLAYPYGTHQTVSARDQRIAAEVGYQAAFMNMIAPLQLNQTDLFAIPRCKVLRGDSRWVWEGSLNGTMDLWGHIEAR